MTIASRLFRRSWTSLTSGSLVGIGLFAALPPANGASLYTVNTQPPGFSASGTTTLNASVNPGGRTASVSFQISTDPTFTPTEQTTIGSGFSLPTFVTENGKGDVLVAEVGGKIKRVESDGNVILVTDLHSSITGMAVDYTASIIYVSEGLRNRVLKIDVARQSATSLTNLVGPRGLAVDATGNLYVVEGADNSVTPPNVANRVTKIFPGGRTVLSGFGDPYSVAVDSAGSLFVSERAKGNLARSGIIKITPSSSERIVSVDFPNGVAVDAAGAVYFSTFSSDGGTVGVRLPDGSTRSLGSGWGANPGFLTVDTVGNLFVPDQTHDEVIKLSPPTLKPTPSALNGTSEQAVSVTVSNLVPGTTYYYRIVATGPGGNVAGATQTFTQAAPPTMSSPTVANVTSSTAQLGGTIAHAGFGAISRRGVLYALTSENNDPKLAGYGVTEVVDNVFGGGAGTFGLFVPGLRSHATYSMVAFAVNSVGVGYTSPATNFTTLDGPPTVIDPRVVSAIGDAAQLSANVVTDGGRAILKRGFLVAPRSINNSPTLGGAGVTEIDNADATTGAFTATATGLSPMTDYAFVAFAVNELGANYTAPVSSFTTWVLPTLTTEPALSVSTNGALLRGSINPNAPGAFYAAYFQISTDPALPPAQETIEGSYTTPAGLAVDAGGNLYVADSTLPHILKLRPDGTSATVGFGFSSPMAVAVDRSGNVYVGDFGSIKKVFPDGAIQTIHSTWGATSLAVDADGNVYAAGFGNGPVLKIFPNGSTTNVGSAFSSVAGLAVDAAGNLYVGDLNKLVRVRPDGAVQTLWPQRVWGVAVEAAGNVYAVDDASGYIVKIQPDGGVVTGFGPRFLYWPALAADDLGNLFVANHVPANPQLVKLAYLTIREATPPSVAGTSPTAISVTVSNLTPSTTYYFRAVASVFGRAFAGPTQSFTTPGPPLITLQPVSQSAPAGGTATFSALAKGLFAGTATNSLADGASLLPGQYLLSPNHGFQLIYQTDGNLVLYRGDELPVWASGTSGRATGRAEMQTDGNLVIYGPTGVPQFATGTHGNPNAVLVLQDDGNLVIYAAGGVPAIFATGTQGSGGTPPPTVQWQVSTNGGATFQDVVGATWPVLSFIAQLGDNGKRYRAVFSNAAGSISTSAATLTVELPPQPTLSVSPAGAGQLQLTWPISPLGYQVEVTTSLSPPNWTPYPATITQRDGLNQVLIPTTTGSQFFRIVIP